MFFLSCHVWSWILCYGNRRMSSSFGCDTFSTFRHLVQTLLQASTQHMGEASPLRSLALLGVLPNMQKDLQQIGGGGGVIQTHLLCSCVTFQAVPLWGIAVPSTMPSALPGLWPMLSKLQPFSQNRLILLWIWLGLFVLYEVLPKYLTIKSTLCLWLRLRTKQSRKRGGSCWCAQVAVLQMYFTEIYCNK